MITRNTKIICTIGPSTTGVEQLVNLINKGMDAARLNFSHGRHEDHLYTIKNIREASIITNKQIPILQDLQGPKIRTGLLENNEVLLNDGDKFIITTDDLPLGNNEKVSTSYKQLSLELKAGNTILLDDGYIILNVDKVVNSDIFTTVVKGGILKNNKGIIAPGVSSLAPSLSEKDIEDLKFGLAHGIDAVALSFVRSERDILELKTAMKIFKRVVPVIAKIERYEGIEDIEDIIAESEGIMVARGDLGLELPPENVPILQKQIIERCNYYGKPVIIATQMLESMINNPRPTRAEASDVANAVIDGADCVMLSGETSVGKYPFDAVDYMNRIIKTVEEKYCKYLSNPNKEYHRTNEVADAMGKAANIVTNQLNAVAIICVTNSGYTPLQIAKYRPNTPIYAFTNNVHTLKQLVLSRGIFPVHITKDIDQIIHTDEIVDILKKICDFKVNDKIVFLSGLSEGNDKENYLKIITID